MDERRRTRFENMLSSLPQTALQHDVLADVAYGSFTSLWLLRSTVRMSASHPKATESLRSSEVTLSATTGREQSQQSVPLYSITSSARASRVIGKVRPSALAVLRLITRSALVDCCTGRSAAFSPLRIRPTYVPTMRYKYAMLVP